MVLYERLMEKFEEGHTIEQLLEEITLAITEEVDELREEINALKERLAVYE